MPVPLFPYSALKKQLKSTVARAVDARAGARRLSLVESRQQQCACRLLRPQLARGFGKWREHWEEIHARELLARRLCNPPLAAAFVAWRHRSTTEARLKAAAKVAADVKPAFTSALIRELRRVDRDWAAAASIAIIAARSPCRAMARGMWHAACGTQSLPEAWSWCRLNPEMAARRLDAWAHLAREGCRKIIKKCAGPCSMGPTTHRSGLPATCLMEPHGRRPDRPAACR